MKAAVQVVLRLVIGAAVSRKFLTGVLANLLAKALGASAAEQVAVLAVSAAAVILGIAIEDHGTKSAPVDFMMSVSGGVPQAIDPENPKN